MNELEYDSVFLIDPDAHSFDDVCKAIADYGFDEVCDAVYEEDATLRVVTFVGPSDQRAAAEVETYYDYDVTTVLSIDVETNDFELLTYIKLRFKEHR